MTPSDEMYITAKLKQLNLIANRITTTKRERDIIRDATFSLLNAVGTSMNDRATFKTPTTEDHNDH